MRRGLGDPGSAPAHAAQRPAAQHRDIVAGRTRVGWAVRCALPPSALPPPRADWIAPLIFEAHRGRGYGDALLAHAGEAGLGVRTQASAFLRRYLAERAFVELEGLAPPGWLHWTPPALRPDPPQGAASLCAITAPPARSITAPPAKGPDRYVLLGRRLCPPHRGWWSFPGGRAEPGEAPWETACREVAEETGIDASRARPVAKHVIAVAPAGRDAPWYRVTSFVVQLPSRPCPQRSREFSAAWVRLEEALSLRPITFGTRRVLRRVLDPAGMDVRLVEAGASPAPCTIRRLADGGFTPEPSPR